MASNDDTINLFLKFQGQAEAEGLRKKLVDLRDQMIAVGSSSTAISPQMVAMANQYKTMSDQADKLDKTFGRAKNADEAKKIADQLVNTERKKMNDLTGDPMTDGMKRAADTNQRLEEKMTELITNGRGRGLLLARGEAKHEDQSGQGQLSS